MINKHKEIKDRVKLWLELPAMERLEILFDVHEHYPHAHTLKTESIAVLASYWWQRTLAKT